MDGEVQIIFDLGNYPLEQTKTLIGHTSTEISLVIAKLLEYSKFGIVLPELPSDNDNFCSNQTFFCVRTKTVTPVNALFDQVRVALVI